MTDAVMVEAIRRLEHFEKEEIRRRQQWALAVHTAALRSPPSRPRPPRRRTASACASRSVIGALLGGRRG